MKLFHLSDLHIGKMLNGYSLRESQKNAFLQVLKYAEEFMINRSRRGKRIRFLTGF